MTFLRQTCLIVTACIFGLRADAACKELAKDYGFQEDKVREVNVNRFMAHIGEYHFTILKALWPRIPAGIQFQVHSVTEA